MKVICHAHCPQPGGTIPAVAAVAGGLALGGGTVAVASILADIAVVLLAVMSVVAVAGVAWFAVLVRQPLWKPSEPRRAALPQRIPSYRVTAEKPRRALSERRVIPGMVIDSDRIRDSGRR